MSGYARLLFAESLSTITFAVALRVIVIIMKISRLPLISTKAFW